MQLYRRDGEIMYRARLSIKENNKVIITAAAMKEGDA